MARFTAGFTAGFVLGAISTFVAVAVIHHLDRIMGR